MRISPARATGRAAVGAVPGRARVPVTGLAMVQFDPPLGAACLPAASPGGACAGAVYSGAPAPPPRTLWQILEATAERFPRAIAIDDGRSVLDYLGLLQEVRRVGDRLASLGIGGGDRVGIR